MGNKNKENFIMMLEVKMEREGVCDRFREEWVGYIFLDDSLCILNIWFVSEIS